MGEALKEFFVALGLDADAASFASAQTMVDALEGALKKLVEWAMKAATALTNAVFSTAAYGSQLDDAAKKTGMSTQLLEEFAYASSLVGGSAETFQHGLIHMARTMGEVKEGSKGATAAFAALGVRVFDANGQFREQDVVLEDVAEAISNLPEGVARMDAAMKIFGKSGADMIPLLADGAEGLRRMRQEFRETVGALTDDQVAVLDKFDDSMVTLRAFGKVITGEFVMPIIEALQPIVDTTLAWIRANRVLISQKVAEWGARFAAVITGIARGVEWLILHFDDLVAWLKIVAATLVGMASAATLLALPALIELVAQFALTAAAAIAAAVSAAAAWTLAALPFLAITAAVALIILAFEDLFVFLEGGQSFIGLVLDRYWTQINAFLQKVRVAIHQLLGPVGGLAFELGLSKFNEAALGVGDFVEGGAASPAAAASLHSSVHTVTNKRGVQVSAPMQFNIHPPPGAPADQVAEEVVKQVKEYLDSEFQRAVSTTPD